MKTGTIRKLLSILDNKFKKKAIVLQVLLLIGVFFESIGLGMLIPLVNVITDTRAAEKNFFIGFLKDNFQIVSDTKLIITSLFCFVLMYFIKTIFISFLLWKQNEFTLGLTRNISTRLFKGYLFQPYAYFLDKNSAILLRNVQSEVSSVNGYVQAIMYLQTEISVLVGIVFTLFYLEPYGAIVVFCFVGSVSYLLFFFTREKLSKWGKERQSSEGERTKSLLEGLSGVSELKLFNKELYYLNKYDESTKYFYKIQSKVQFMQQAQRYYLEFILILSIGVLSVTVLFQGKTIGTILPSLSLFLFAALRMLPSANRIITSLQSMRFTKPGVDLMHHELEVFSRENETMYHESNCIKSIDKNILFENVGFVYPSSKYSSLKNINLEISIGSVVGIIGQSGAGKTTLVNILTGLLNPTTGSVTADNIDISQHLVELRKFVGYVPQSVFLIDDTLKRNIAFGIDNDMIDDRQIENVIESAQLTEVVSQMGDGVNTIIGERGVKLSGGQRQRIGIARALYNNPSILILDEGTSALDNETESYIMNSVAKLKGKLTIIVVAHRYSTLHFCDIVYKMHGGAIVGKGKLEELI